MRRSAFGFWYTGLEVLGEPITIESFGLGLPITTSWYEDYSGFF
jgi:hypothetical protein